MPVTNRRELLDAANKAVSKGRIKAAIGHYLRTMEDHGTDPAIDAKVATLYHKLRRQTRARLHFEKSSARFRNDGFEEKALAVYRNAVACFPTEVEFWQRIVDLQRAQGRKADAVNTLMEARKAFRKGPMRAQAAQLLEQIIKMEPGHPQASLDLALVMMKMGRREEARQSLQSLVGQSRGSRLRRVRGALFRLSPTPAAAWRWLRAALLGR